MDGMIFLRLRGIKGLGVDIREIISGTSPENLDWSRLRSDIYGKPIWFPEQSNLTGLGAALVGLVGIDIYDDLETAVSECKLRREQMDPDSGMIEYYERQWKQYKGILPIARSLKKLVQQPIPTLRDVTVIVVNDACGCQKVRQPLILRSSHLAIVVM